MDTRAYKEPDTKALTAFLKELKEKTDISQADRFMVWNLLSPLLNAKSPDANKLFIAGLIWLVESDKPPISIEFLNQGLGINATNNLDDKHKIIYLAKLAEHVKAEELKSKKETKEKETKEYTFKDEIVSVASHVLDRISFKQTPLSVMKDFKGISEQYRDITKNPGFFRRWIGTATERTNQQFFIETLATLCTDLAKEGLPFDYNAIMLGASLYIMYQIENSYSRRHGGGELYPLLKAKTKVEHSSQVELEAQKLLFDALFKFIEDTTISQWKKSRPADAKNFDVASFLSEMHKLLPKIKLCENRPHSLPYFVVSRTWMAAACIVGYTKEFALLKMAEDLYLIHGVGKNSLILTLAGQVGDKLASYAGKIPGFFIKQGTLALGEVAEKKAVTFSVTGIARTTLSYLLPSDTEETVKHTPYDPTLDPFESLIQLALLHAKTKREENNVEYFQAVLVIHRMLPAQIKEQLAERAQHKVTLPEPEPGAPTETYEVELELEGLRKGYTIV